MTPFGDLHPAVEPHLAGGVLTIDIGALVQNWRLLCRIAGRARVAAVVKGDGYGIGLETAVTALQGAGCRTFFVALPEEGLRVAGIAPGAEIYVLDGLLPSSAADYAAAKLRPVLGNIGEIEEWSAHCRAIGRRLPAAVHVDTGMHRLGLEAAEFTRLFPAGGTLRDGGAKDFEPTLVMSHLACADDVAHPLNAIQIKRFGELRTRLAQVPASLANSAGTLAHPDSHFDLVRPGVALYGGRAVANRPNPMRPVVHLRAQILRTRTARAGETVGYGAAQTLQRDSRLAILAAGYADGILRAAGGGGERSAGRAVLAGHSLPMVGRISMDLIVVDVTDLPEGLARRGAWVELLGETITVDELAGHAGTIGYEILTSLGRRYHRKIIDETGSETDP